MAFFPSREKIVQALLSVGLSVSAFMPAKIAEAFPSPAPKGASPDEPVVTNSPSETHFPADGSLTCYIAEMWTAPLTINFSVTRAANGRLVSLMGDVPHSTLGKAAMLDELNRHHLPDGSLACDVKTIPSLSNTEDHPDQTMQDYRKLAQTHGNIVVSSTYDGMSQLGLSLYANMSLPNFDQPREIMAQEYYRIGKKYRFSGNVQEELTEFEKIAQRNILEISSGNGRHSQHENGTTEYINIKSIIPELTVNSVQSSDPAGKDNRDDYSDKGNVSNDGNLYADVYQNDGKYFARLQGTDITVPLHEVDSGVKDVSQAIAQRVLGQNAANVVATDKEYDDFRAQEKMVLQQHGFSGEDWLDADKQHQMTQLIRNYSATHGGTIDKLVHVEKICADASILTEWKEHEGCYGQNKQAIQNGLVPIPLGIEALTPKFVDNESRASEKSEGTGGIERIMDTISDVIYRAGIDGKIEINNENCFVENGTSFAAPRRGADDAIALRQTQSRLRQIVEKSRFEPDRSSETYWQDHHVTPNQSGRYR